MQITRLDVINTLYTLCVSTLSILLPLYLISQDISVSNIGIILSISSLIFLIFRVIFASIADSIGTRKISLFYSITGVLSVFVYSISASPLFFGLGTALDGFKSAGFWSIIRTESLSESNPKIPPSQVLIHYANLRQIVEGFGRLFAGFIIAYVGFSNTFSLLMVISFLVLALNFSKPERFPAKKSSSPFYKKILQKRSKTFWKNSLLQSLVWLPYNLCAGFILPLFLRLNLDYSFEQTGFFIALFMIFIGCVSIISKKLSLKLHTLYQLSFLIIIGFFLFFFSSNPIFPILLISLGMGASNILAEYLLSESLRESKEFSTDVALIFAPLKVFEFICVFVGGFVISSFGFAPIFVFFMFLILIFLFFSKRHLINSNVPI